MKRYVVGFVFTADYEQVLLMTKNRPDWQIGRMNGIGGKIEADEPDVSAIVRESKEESDLDISEQEWVLCCTSTAPDWEVLFFGAVLPGRLADAKSVTDEPVAWYSTETLPANVIDNLRWLIPLSINRLKKVDALGSVRADYQWSHTS